uniref:ribosomal protein L6 n=1 Tax=Chrysotila carterae TaxID=13221 RepID=UPI0022F30482|nr:ribosomal protein L6 [Chrysotila carterae]WAK83179.1 ribosomal protein L6 [Chrysotila carterae]|eukprot:6211973-Pleurochrysis_carterae.AAC.3
MSRIGKSQIEIPNKVKVEVEGQKVTVNGPKGNLSRVLPSFICCRFDKEQKNLILENAEDTKLTNSLYGLSRTLIANMVTGVSTGFNRKLKISGVGYRAQLSGKDLILHMGYSHPVHMVTPPDVVVSLEGQTTIVVSGVEKDVVGEFTANIRSVRPPEPYKGKGIAYEGEVIRRKAGKTGKK